jgi:DNA replication initiation complex subunit (GINS family)
MEEIRVLTRDNFQSKIDELFRIEIKSKKLHKLPVGFYDSLKKEMQSYVLEMQNALDRKDIEAYISLKEQKSEFEKNFRMFFQRRWEKIASLAQYDIDQDLLMVLSSYEKAAALEFKTVYNKFYGQFVGGEQ